MDLGLLKNIATFIVAIGVLSIGAAYVMGQVKQGRNNAQEDLNKTLNELLEARDKKIKDLEEGMKEQGKKIAYLAGQVETLQTQKTDMEILIKTALKEHFAAHPDMAIDLQGKMNN